MQKITPIESSEKENVKKVITEVVLKNTILPGTGKEAAAVIVMREYGLTFDEILKALQYKDAHDQYVDSLENPIFKDALDVVKVTYQRNIDQFPISKKVESYYFEFHELFVKSIKTSESPGFFKPSESVEVKPFSYANYTRTIGSLRQHLPSVDIKPSKTSKAVVLITLLKHNGMTLQNVIRALGITNDRYTDIIPPDKMELVKIIEEYYKEEIQMDNGNFSHLLSKSSISDVLGYREMIDPIFNYHEEELKLFSTYGFSSKRPMAKHSIRPLAAIIYMSELMIEVSEMIRILGLVDDDDIMIPDLGVSSPAEDCLKNLTSKIKTVISLKTELRDRVSNIERSYSALKASHTKIKFPEIVLPGSAVLNSDLALLGSVPKPFSTSVKDFDVSHMYPSSKTIIVSDDEMPTTEERADIIPMGSGLAKRGIVPYVKVVDGVTYEFTFDYEANKMSASIITKSPFCTWDMDNTKSILELLEEIRINVSEEATLNDMWKKKLDGPLVHPILRLPTEISHLIMHNKNIIKEWELSYDDDNFLTDLEEAVNLLTFKIKELRQNLTLGELETRVFLLEKIEPMVRPLSDLKMLLILMNDSDINKIKGFRDLVVGGYEFSSADMLTSIDILKRHWAEARLFPGLNLTSTSPRFANSITKIVKTFISIYDLGLGKKLIES